MLYHIMMDTQSGNCNYNGKTPVRRIVNWPKCQLAEFPTGRRIKWPTYFDLAEVAIGRISIRRNVWLTNCFLPASFDHIHMSIRMNVVK